MKRLRTIIFTAGLAICQQLNAQEIFVSPNGKDSNPGTKEKPFATLNQARDFLRQKGPRNTPATVYLRGGMYNVSSSFELSKEDGGTQNAPVIYAAFDNENVILSGAKAIESSAFKKVKDKTTLQRINPELRNKILELDLKKYNITHRTMMPNIFTDAGNIMGLFIGNERMPLSRYPNTGYMTIKKVLIPGGGQETKGEDWRNFYADGAKEAKPPRPGVFEYRDQKHSKWANLLDRGVFFKGYWRIPWQNEAVRVAKIDTLTKTVTFSVPVPGGIGNKYSRPEGNGQEQYWLLNLLEEVDMPGEWAVDAEDEKLYYYPKTENNKQQIYIADNYEPVIRVKNASYIFFKNLTIENNLGDGIKISGGNNNTIAGCTIRSVNKYAVTLDKGKENTVLSSNLYNLGAGGVWLSGGNETSNPRIAAGHKVINNHIHHFSQIEKIYTPAVNVGFTGGGGGGHHVAVGNYIANNLVHDTPHAGMLFGSWDNVFEYNEVFRMCTVSNDMGAFYAYDLFEKMGNNTFRYNFVHNSPDGDGIYFDHDHRDLNVYGNIVALNSEGGKRGTGFLYKIGSQAKNPQVMNCYNNIAINCSYGFQFVNVASANNVINNNVAVNAKFPFQYREIVNSKEVTVAESVLTSGKNMAYASDPGFVNMAKFDFRLKPDSKIFKDLPGFQPIPVEKMGLFLDEYRKKLPTNDEIKRFENPTNKDALWVEIKDRN